MSRFVGVLAIALLAGDRVDAADFIRGDVNGDGEVTLADAHVLSGHLFLGRDDDSLMDCIVAGDVNDDGHMDVADSVGILVYLVFGAVYPGEARQPSAPFPEPGPDPTPDPGPFGCEAYGGGEPLEDPVARLAILDVTAPGGANRLATLTLATSSSADIGSLRAVVSHDPGLVAQIGEAPTGVRDRFGLFRDPNDESALWTVAAVDGDGLLSVGVHPFWPACSWAADDTLECDWFPAGEGQPALDINICLEPGTPAGEYTLTLEEAEFADADTGRAIYPQLESGTLTVLTDVEVSDCDPNPPPPPPPPDVTFALQDTIGAPGGSTTVPFRITSTLPSQGFSFSIDFDEEVLHATEIERLFRRPSGTPYEFQTFEFNNENRFPGNDELLEGYLVGAAIISLTDTDDILPPGEEVAVLNFHFDIDPDPQVSETEIRFLDGGLGSDGAQVQNHLIASGRSIMPDAANSFVFVDAILRIVPDAVPFLRGDSNSDGNVDLSDPINTLDYLFLGGPPPSCLDAADVNDDGGVNLSDAVYTLEFLFRGTLSALPLPYPGLGPDPTEDGLRCLGG